MDDHSQRDDPDRRHWSGWKLEERHEEPEPSLGGTLEAPPHESTGPTVAGRVAWRIVGGVCLFVLLMGVLWLTETLGWRRVVAGVSSVLLLIGALMVRQPEMSRGDANELWRRQRREIDEPASSPEMLAREVRASFIFVGGLLIALGSVGLVVAVRGE